MQRHSSYISFWWNITIFDFSNLRKLVVAVVVSFIVWLPLIPGMKCFRAAAHHGFNSDFQASQIDACCKLSGLVTLHSSHPQFTGVLTLNINFRVSSRDV